MTRKNSRVQQSIVLFTCLTTAMLSAEIRANYSILHDFTGTFGAATGADPTGELVVVNGRLFGTASLGGANNRGTLYSLELDGSNFQKIHDFAGGANDGHGPAAGLIEVNGRLFGTTPLGGSAGAGVVFGIDQDGSNFQVLHSLNGGSDGAQPHETLATDGNFLFGTTRAAGSSQNSGTLFSVTTDGTTFQKLHTFAISSTNGHQPRTVPTIDGSLLYGTTSGGTTNNFNGTIFSIETDGSDFQLLHDFSGGDGNLVEGGFAQVGSVLYGTARLGGDHDLGTIYSIHTDGSNFQVLHHFAGGAADGAFPFTSKLVVDGSTIYGATAVGGDTNDGTLYSIKTDGSGFQLLHEFTGTNSGGGNPSSSPILHDGVLYGTTLHGGQGKIYSFVLPIPEPTSFTILAGVAAPILCARRRVK